MKVKIRNKVYDANKEPIMLIFNSEKERKNIAKQIETMDKKATKYCIYPSTKEWTENNYQKIKKWMSETDK